MKSGLFLGAKIIPAWSLNLFGDEGGQSLSDLPHVVWVEIEEISGSALQKILSRGAFSPEVGFVGRLDTSDMTMHFFDEARVVGFVEDIFFWLQEKGVSVSWPLFSCVHFLAELKEGSIPLSPSPFVVEGIEVFEKEKGAPCRILWQFPIVVPFEEMEHTADLAFIVRGKDWEELYLHACGALYFTCPELYPFLSGERVAMDGLDQIVIQLNRVIATIDQEVGSPFKAVSFNGKVIRNSEGIYEWEMIIDV